MDELERKSIETILESNITTKGVQALGDRPNLTAQYGASGLTPAQLKKWFDALSTIAIEKINAIINAINEKNSAQYIGVDLEDIDNLAKLIKALETGKFAEIEQVSINNKKMSLQEAITTLKTEQVQVIKLV